LKHWVLALVEVEIGAIEYIGAGVKGWLFLFDTFTCLLCTDPHKHQRIEFSNIISNSFKNNLAPFGIWLLLMAHLVEHFEIVSTKLDLFFKIGI
jgi:hypothetical protein